MREVEQLQHLIEAFVDFNPATHLAHVALEDFNLGDKMIQWLIDEEIPRLRVEEEHMDGFRPDANDVDQVIAFLKFLLIVPESLREQLPI